VDAVLKNRELQRWCCWAGVAFVLALFAGLLIAGFVPPVNPNQSPDALKEFFVAHSTRIRVGMLVGLLGTGLAGPFVAVITIQLKRVEGPFAPLAYAQLLLGAMLPIALIFGMTWLMCAAYRPDRDAQSIQAYSDQAWFMIVGAFYMFVIQLACIAIAVLRDESPAPVLPRWLGYLNIWCALGSLPAAGVYFVNRGPLAWNGLLSFWLPAVCFGTWATATSVAVLRGMPSPTEPAAT
jgi:hypothetical protein